MAREVTVTALGSFYAALLWRSRCEGAVADNWSRRAERERAEGSDVAMRMSHRGEVAGFGVQGQTRA